MQHLVERQRLFFASGKTRSTRFRLAQLKKLKFAVKDLEADILKALHKDLGKPAFEAYTSEVGLVYEEINHALKYLTDWIRPQRVSTPLAHQPAQSMIYPQPKGVICVIGAWNYPFLLMLSPLVGAISAGNCAILKPSEVAGTTARILSQLIERTFSPDFCAVVQGGAFETAALLKLRFDHIFFTGSAAVGRAVMRAAAEHLTPVTLELGGKSPCIVDIDAGEKDDLAVAARRIIWGKFYNAGQTCIAPDYVLVQRSQRAELIAAMKQCLREFFGPDPYESLDFGRIINGRQWDRLMALIAATSRSQIVTGGHGDRARLYISPTILDQITFADAVMQEEIFGPILPVVSYESLDEALMLVRQQPAPLACYAFTNHRSTEQRVIQELNFGSGCINNTLIQFDNPYLPFGGVGQSGMGSYHGRHSFEAFSHRKAVVKSPLSFDLKFRYPPYTGPLNLIRKMKS